METKKNYQAPSVEVVEVESQIIATSGGGSTDPWDAQSINLEMEMGIEENGIAD